MPDVKWFLQYFEPVMLYVTRGGRCKRCSAWIPAALYDEYENYKQHMAWHEGLETKWSS